MSSKSGGQGSKGHGRRGVQGALTNDPITGALLDDGEAAALAAALERRRGQATAIALQITGDAAEAADLVQEAYLSARRRLGHFRGEAALETWLLRIVINLALKSVRRRNVRQRLRYLLPLPAPPAAADWLAECREELARLGRALERLPARQRAAFVLRHAHGMKVAEVAELLEVSVPTVKTHLLRATRRLRREVLGRDEE